MTTRPLLALLLAAGLSYAQPWPHNHAKGLGSDLEALCVSLNNSYECAKAIERFQLGRKLKGVSRQGLTLTIRTTQGAIASFTNPTKEEDPKGVWYAYLKPLTDVGYHLLHVQHYEGTQAMLVSMRTGRKTIFPAFSFLSPDNRHFITLGPSETHSTIQIWSLVPEPSLEWSSPSDTWELLSARWLALDRAEITKTDHNSNAPDAIVIAKGQKGWSLANE